MLCIVGCKFVVECDKIAGFVKRGLLHTFNSPGLMIHNFRLGKAIIDLKDGQHQRV